MKWEFACSEEELEKIFREILSTQGIFPFEIQIEENVDKPHGQYLEFGSDPVSEGKSVPYSKILAWVITKHPGKSRKEQESMAHFIRDKINKEGTTPHPFIEPALEWARDIKFNEFLDSGRSSTDLGEAIISRMRLKLEENTSIYKWQVYDSLRVARTDDWTTRPEPIDVKKEMERLKEEYR